MSLCNRLGLLNKLNACHIGWAVAWQVADDRFGVGARVDRSDGSDGLRHDALADTAAVDVDHSGNVVLSACLFTSNGRLDSVVSAQQVGNTAALVLDLSGIVELQEDVVDWFVALAVPCLDAGAVDVLDESLDTLAACATICWALEVFHCLCLAGLGTRALGWDLTAGTNIWYWCWFLWRQFLAGWAALSFDHNCFLCVWIADGAGLWFLNQFVVETDEFCTSVCC